MWILKIFACGARYARGSTPSTPVFEKFWHGGGLGAKFFNNHVFIVPPIGFLHEKTNVARGARKQYLVRWRGYPASEASWTPARELQGTQVLNVWNAG